MSFLTGKDKEEIAEKIIEDITTHREEVANNLEDMDVVMAMIEQIQRKMADIEMKSRRITMSYVYNLLREKTGWWGRCDIMARLKSQPNYPQKQDYYKLINRITKSRTNFQMFLDIVNGDEI